MSASVVAPAAVVTTLAPAIAAEITAGGIVVQTATGIFVISPELLTPSEVAALADALSLAASTGQFDQTMLQDLLASGVAKPVNDIASSTDAVLLGVAKTEIDPASLDDNVEKHLALAALENLFVQQSLVIDGVALTLLVSAADFPSVSELLVKSVEGLRVDLASLSDEHFIALALTQTDIGTISDNITTGFGSFQQDSSNLADSQIISIGLSAADNLFISQNLVIDLAALTLNVSATDAARLVDSGSLVSQGYTDSNQYFAADFVGISISF